MTNKSLFIKEKNQPLKLSEVWVVIVAFNARNTLKKLVLNIPKRVKIVLVDDCCEDGTGELARSLGLTVLSHVKNKGYGAAQKTGYDYALKKGAGVVVLLHGDFQYHPKYIPELIEPILLREADFTFGSRFLNGNDPRKFGMGFFRFVGNVVTTRIENFLLGTTLTDFNSGLRAFNSDFLKKLNYQKFSDGYLFDSQSLIKAINLGCRVREVGINAHYDKFSLSISGLKSLKYMVETIILAYKSKVR